MIEMATEMATKMIRMTIRMTERMVRTKAAKKTVKRTTKRMITEFKLHAETAVRELVYAFEAFVFIVDFKPSRALQ
jgi:hypothetical protein